MTRDEHRQAFRKIIAAYPARGSLTPADRRPVLTPLPDMKVILFDVYGTLLLSERNDPGTDGKLDSLTLDRLQVFTAKYAIDREPPVLVTDVLQRIAAVNRASFEAGVEYPEVNIIHIWSEVLGRTDYSTLKFIALEFEMIVHQCRPAGDLAALFAQLRRKGIKLGIVSNAQFYTQVILEYFLGRTLAEEGFDKRLILYSYIYRTAKPSERLFQKVTDRITQAGLRPEDVLFAGDNPENDLKPARRAGFKTLFFCGNETAVHRTDDGQADAVITDWDQIAQILI